MKNFKQWICDKLFALLTWLSPTEQPTPDELRAWAREEVQKPPQPQIWYDPTVRSYPQPQAPPRVLHVPPGSLTRAYHDEMQISLQVSGKLPRISQVLPRIRLKPVDHSTKQPIVRTNTEPIDPAKDFPDWLRSGPLTVEHMTPAEIERVPTIRDLTPKFDPEDTNEVPAIMKMFHQDRYEAHRHSA